MRAAAAVCLRAAGVCDASPSRQDTRLYAKPTIVRALLTYNVACLRVLDIVALQPAATWRLIVRCVGLQLLRVHFIGPWNTVKDAEHTPRLDGMQHLVNLTTLELGGAELLAPYDVDVAVLRGLTCLQLNMPVAHSNALPPGALQHLQAVSFPELYCGLGLPTGLPSLLTSLKLDAWRPTEDVGPDDDVVRLLTRPPAIGGEAAEVVRTDLAALAHRLPNLQVLHLGAYPGGPDLTCIAPAMQHARLPTTITSLGLRRCSLTELPAPIQHLRALASLDLRYNHLRSLPCWTTNLHNLRRVRLERQRGPAFCLTLPLSLASRPGLVIQISPTLETLVHQAHGTRLRLVVRLVSASGETLCHLSLLNNTVLASRGAAAHRPRLAAIGGSIKATQRMAASRGWRASLRPGAVEDMHVEGGGCGCMVCTRRACCVALRNLVLIHDDAGVL